MQCNCTLPTVSDFLTPFLLLLCSSAIHRRYAQLICSVITLQGGSDWGVGGGGETMMVHDVNTMRTEMIGKHNSVNINMNININISP